MNAIILAAALVPGAVPPLTADLILFNGKVWTGVVDREAQAVAVRHGRVVLVGTDAEVKRAYGGAVREIDLKGRRVVPGFHDSHVHFLEGGLLLSRVNLKDAKDEAEFGRRLLEFDRNLPRDRWIVGGNWDHDRTFGGKLPTAATVDQFVKDRPVFISRYDGHMALANTAALKLAGVTADTKDPPGGVVFRLADGKTPSGVLKDNAMSLVGRFVPPPSREEIAQALRAADQVAAETGVTSVQDMDGSDPATRRLYFRMLQDRESGLTCRVTLYWPIERYKELADLGLLSNFGTDWIQIGGVKGFMDGSLGSSTAKMFEPYLGDPKNTGVWVTEPETMRSLIRGATAAGLRVCVHAIGDEANHQLLRLFLDQTEKFGPRGTRWFRVEHAQHLRPEDYALFDRGKVIASMQPYHAIDDGRWAEGRIGAKRCASSYAFRSLLDNGAKLAFGSDWPVAPLDPLAGIDAAVNRRTLDGKHPNGWFPEQRTTVAEAIEAYTWGSAVAAGQERDRGQIHTGRLADIVVLSRDILDPAERDRIADTKVDYTIVGGRIVYERK